MHLGVLAVVFALLAASLTSEAQQAGKMYRIGILWLNPLAATSHLLDAFRQGLRELGYVEGQNITIEFRSAEGKLERVPPLAAELVRLKVDVIVTGTTPLIRAAQQATVTIPIVMGVSNDPVEDGFVANLARPGRNITGLSLQSPEIAGKRLGLLREVVPTLSRVAVLWEAEDTAAAFVFRETEVAARALGVRLQSLPLRYPSEDLEGAFRAATGERAGALIAVESLLTFRHRKRIADLAARSRLPSVGGWKEYAEAGGLIAYGASLPDMFRRAATFVIKILNGTKPAELPVERPTRFELAINLKTAKAFGLTIPAPVLLRADSIFE